MSTQSDPGGLAGLKRLAVDVLSGWMFLALFLTTGDIYLATGAALVAGIGQVVWMISRRQRSIRCSGWRRSWWSGWAAPRS